MCKHLSSPEVQVRSQRASDARKKQALNHTNGSESFARKMFERRLKDLAIDPLTMFNETHKDENHNLPPVCAKWKREMNGFLKKKQRGEIDCSLEEIYNRSLILLELVVKGAESKQLCQPTTED